MRGMFSVLGVLMGRKCRIAQQRLPLVSPAGRTPPDFNRVLTLALDSTDSQYPLGHCQTKCTIR